MSNPKVYPLAEYLNDSGVLVPGQEGIELRDLFAIKAPPVPDWFVPLTYERRGVRTHPDTWFGDKESPGFENLYGFYDLETKTWDDDDAAREGVTISESLKSEVAEYVTNWEDDVHDDYLWERHYAQQKMFQWPYYYADKLCEQRDIPYSS